MVQLSGQDWSGSLVINTTTTSARGRINGYPWYFKLKCHSWMVEIAEEQAVEPDDLPLVGFGCSGWLYECNENTLPTHQSDCIDDVNKKLCFAFSMFNQNKLKYFPTVTCCSD